MPPFAQQFGSGGGQLCAMAASIKHRGEREDDRAGQDRRASRAHHRGKRNVAGRYALKNMASGEQLELTLDEITATLAVGQAGSLRRVVNPPSSGSSER